MTTAAGLNPHSFQDSQNRTAFTLESAVRSATRMESAWTAEGLSGPEKGYIALQAEVPAGGQFRFRNLYITELP